MKLKHFEISALVFGGGGLPLNLAIYFLFTRHLAPVHGWPQLLIASLNLLVLLLVVAHIERRRSAERRRNEQAPK